MSVADEDMVLAHLLLDIHATDTVPTGYKEVGLFTQMVNVGDINPRSEMTYAGYERQPYLGGNHHFSYPVATEEMAEQLCRVRCAAILVHGVVMKVAPIGVAL